MAALVDSLAAGEPFLDTCQRMVACNNGLLGLSCLLRETIIESRENVENDLLGALYFCKSCQIFLEQFISAVSFKVAPDFLQ